LYDNDFVYLVIDQFIYIFISTTKNTESNVLL